MYVLPCLGLILPLLIEVFPPSPPLPFQMFSYIIPPPLPPLHLVMSPSLEQIECSASYHDEVLPCVRSSVFELSGLDIALFFSSPPFYVSSLRLIVPR